MSRPRSNLLISIAAHAAFAGGVATLVALHPVRRAEAPVTFEVVRVPPPPIAAIVPDVAPLATSAGSAAAPVIARRAPMRTLPPAPSATLPIPAADDAPDVPSAPLGAPVGSAADVSFAPPPPPPPPRVIVHAEADATFVDSGYVRLETLVVSWEHNDGVRGCIEQTLGSGERLAQLGRSAHDRMLDALRRGDHDAAVSEARHLHDTASSFDALYRRAHRCIE